MWFSDWPITGQPHFWWPAEHHFVLQNVFGQVHQHRAGAARLGDIERLGDDAWNIVAITDEEVVFGHRHGDAGDVGFLEGIGADEGPPNLSGDRNDRHTVHRRIGQRCHQVRRAWTGGGHAHSDSPCRLRVTGCGVASALLMTNEDMPHFLRIVKRIVDGQNCAARNTEYDIGTDFLKGSNNRLGTGHAFRADSSILIALCRGGGSSRRWLCRWCAHVRVLAFRMDAYLSSVDHADWTTSGRGSVGHARPIETASRVMCRSVETPDNKKPSLQR